MPNFQFPVQPPIAAWQEGVTALLLITVAMASRDLIVPIDGGLPFLTLYPAVALAYLLGGVRCGLLVTVLSAVVAQRYLGGAGTAVAVTTSLVFLGASAVMALLRHREQRGMKQLAQTMAALHERDRAMTRQAQELRELYEQAPAGHCILTPAGQFLRVNQTTAHWLGGDRAAILASPGLHCYLREQSQQAFAHALASVLAGERVAPLDLELAPPGRPGRWLSLSMTALPDALGNVTAVQCSLGDISVHKAQELQLRLLNQNELAILDCGLFIAAKVRDGRFSWVSAGMVRALGYPAAELLGRTVDLLRPPGRSADVFETALRSVIQSGDHQQAEIEVICSDRSRRSLEVTGLLLDADTGEVLWLAADITARKALERERTQQAARIQDLYDNAPCGYSVVDSAGFFTEINETQLGWLGLTRSAVIGRCKPCDFVASEDREVFTANLYNLRSAQTEVNLDYRLVNPDGQSRWVALRAYPVRDAEGKVFSTRCVAFDISDRKALDLTLQRVNAEQAAVLNCDLFGVARSVNRVITWSNLGLQRMLGYSADELHGLPSSALFLSPADHHAHGERCYPLLWAGQDYRCELAMRRKDGQAIWVDVTVRLVNPATGESLSFWFDITARRDAERELATIRSEQEAIINSDLLGIARMSNRHLNWVSPGLARMFGYTVDALQGQPTRLIYTNEETYIALGEDAYPKILTGQTWRGELPMRRRDGQTLWVELTGETFALTGETLWIVTDITHQHEIKRALRESQDMLERTGTVAGIGGWQIDLPTQKVHWSMQTHRMLEAPEGFVPDLASALALYPPASLQLLEPALAIAARDGTPFDLELELTTLTGRRIWARVVGEAEVTAGQVTRLVGAFQDVTARRAAAPAGTCSHEHERVT